MFKKKLMSLGIAVIFTLSSLTTTVFAADFSKLSTGANVTAKLANPGKGKGFDKAKPNKGDEKKYKFDDIQEINWAANAIEKLAGKGILGGVGQGRFAPRSNVTQLEALAMVLRLTGDNTEADSKSSLVHPLYNGAKPSWGLGYIYVAIEKGILVPEELKSFNPFTPAKRHEIAKYIIRALGKTDEALKHMDEDLPFNDEKAVPEKSVGYVYLINEMKIMTGNNNNFKPMEPVTRAEMAVLLDRAEGNFDTHDTDTRKNNILFVSANSDGSKITVKAQGNTVTYNVLEGAQVYKDGTFKDVEDLVEGDVLQLTFNTDKKVIFIDVVKDAGTTEETELSFTEPEYSSLPEVLQDKIDDLKDTRNYKAFEYNGYVYLFASMGEKRTSGYSIDIEKLNKVDNGSDFVVKAEVDIDEPSSSDAVNQVVTHPYSVVKFKNFSDIDYVRFVNTDDEKLADADIVNVDEATSVEGTIYDIISSSKTIKVEKSNGAKVSYTVPSSAEIVVGSDNDAEFSALEEGMNVEVQLSDNKVIKVIADYDEENELSYDAVDYDELSSVLKEQVDYLKLTRNYKAYEYDDYVYLIATMGRKSSSGYDIVVDSVYKVDNGDDYIIKAIVETDTTPANDNTTTYPYSIVKFKQFNNIDVVRFFDEDNSKLAETRVVELDEAVTVSGTINDINSSNKTIKVEKSNGSVVTLSIPSDAEITVNDDENESFGDLVKGMRVEVELVADRVVKVTAEDKLAEVHGTLIGISINTEKKITLREGTSTKTYTVPSDAKVTIEGETARVEDLKINSELTLKFINGLLVEIVK